MTCSTDDAIDALYSRIDSKLRGGDFAGVDAELTAVDVERSEATMLLGWLTITLAAREGEVSIEQMREVISAMTDNVLREGAGEIVDSREARAAIGKKTAGLFKSRLRAALETP